MNLEGFEGLDKALATASTNKKSIKRNSKASSNIINNKKDFTAGEDIVFKGVKSKSTYKNMSFRIESEYYDKIQLYAKRYNISKTEVLNAIIIYSFDELFKTRTLKE